MTASLSGDSQDKMVRACLECFAPPTSSAGEPRKLPGETITLQFNPAELTLTKGASWSRHRVRSAASAATPEFTGSQPRVLTLKILLDGADKGGSVDARMTKLLKWCAPTEDSIDADRPSPPWLVFRWGKFESVSFLSCLRQVEAVYSLFSPQGSPERATCTLVLEEIGLAQRRQNPTSGSPDSRHVHTVIAGDTLPSIVHRHLGGSPAEWREIAERNSIDDPTRMRVGQRLVLPLGGPDRHTV
ncbi:LysM peptidoglycan-binding domain-containing protein [Streptomyces sp. NPDC050658]|uniref:CIS tube protein n=1 Tax=unclassified Streptomyces TaxID=2593676 RepID=UPI0034212382